MCISRVDENLRRPPTPPEPRRDGVSERRGYQRALGTAIKVERERRKLNSETLAPRAGVTEQWLLKVEAGKGDPTWGQLRRLADAMEVPLPKLMERIEDCEEEKDPMRALGGRSADGRGRQKRGRSKGPQSKPEARPQEALARALSHPLRAQALAILVERTASPKEIADELDETLPNVSYHVRALEDLGLIELVEEEPVRGSVAHFYRAEQDISDQAWNWSTLLLDEEGWRKVIEIQSRALEAVQKEQASAGRRLAASRRKRLKATFGLLLFRNAPNPGE